MAARAVGALEPAEVGLIVWLPRELARAVTKQFLERPPGVDKIEGTLEVGTNDKGEVVVNLDEDRTGHIIFSPAQAQHFARLLLQKAADAQKL